jgi:hypothetical protein
VILFVIGILTGKRVLELGLIFGAILGIALSAAARWQVRRSEGARTGMTMANISWWTCVVCGLVYGAYYLGTVLSIRAQAQEFLDASWYPALQKRELDKAFYYTQKPMDRRRRSERDVIERFAENYTSFRRLELVHVIERSNGELLVEPEGFTGQEEKQQTVTLQQLYSIRTREGVFRGAVRVDRTTPKELEGAQYHAAVSGPTLHEKKLTTYGRMIREMHKEAENFLRDYAQKNAPYRFVDFYLDTQDVPSESRRDQVQQYFLNVFLRNSVLAMSAPGGGLGLPFRLAPLLGDNDINRSLLMQTDSMKVANQLIKVKDATPSKGAGIADLMRLLIMRGASIVPPTALLQAEVPLTMEMKTNEIRMGLPTECQLPYPLGFAAHATVYAKLIGPDVYRELERLRQADWKTMPEDQSSGILISKIPHHWVITEIHIDLSRPVESPNSPTGPGPGAGPPGPPPGPSR